jgi:hypothetical protein
MSSVRRVIEASDKLGLHNELTDPLVVVEWIELRDHPIWVSLFFKARTATESPILAWRCSPAG